MKFSRRSCQDSNPRLFDHESDTLTTIRLVGDLSTLTGSYREMQNELGIKVNTGKVDLGLEREDRTKSSSWEAGVAQW